MVPKSREIEPSTLVGRIVAGDVGAAARLMRALEDDLPGARRVLRELLPRTGRAHIVGITGAPGTGKSSLVAQLVSTYRQLHRAVGVVAVDPTSPFTGGALLGDRIRMQAHAVDPGVFIRSMANRGHLGGLARATSDVALVMDAMGKDVVVVETVGVGQDEIEVATLAQTVVVVSAPGLGDDVQALKEGVLEIADVFVVNKADLAGAQEAARHLLERLEVASPGQANETSWSRPVVMTVALRGQGIPELAEAIESHRAFLAAGGVGRIRERRRAQATFVALLGERLLSRALDRLSRGQPRLDDLVARISSRETDSFELASRVAASLIPARGPSKVGGTAGGGSPPGKRVAK